MTMQLFVTRFDDATDVNGTRAATELLVDANRAYPTGRLLGSIAVPRSDLNFARHQFTDVVFAAMHGGHVNLVRDGGQLVGVACWIAHPAGHRADTPGWPALPSGMTRRPAAWLVRDSLERLGLGRLDLLDLALEVPDDSTHLHLACLGTVTGHHSRMIDDLLLYGQFLLADRYGHTLYTEAHSEKDRNWLQILDFDDCGPSLGDPADPQSYVMVRTPQPSTSGPCTPAPVPP